MVNGKRVQNTFLSPPHKNIYIRDEESQVIFYACYSKTLLDGDLIERFYLSPYSSLN